MVSTSWIEIHGLPPTPVPVPPSNGCEGCLGIRIVVPVVTPTTVWMSSTRVWTSLLMLLRKISWTFSPASVTAPSKLIHGPGEFSHSKADTLACRFIGSERVDVTWFSAHAAGDDPINPNPATIANAP